MQHLLDPFVLVRRLYDLGFLKARSLECAFANKPEAISQALVEYQQMLGLKPDGWCGPITRDSLLLPRFCGHPDRMEQQAEGRLCRWPQKQISWTLQGSLPGSSNDQVIDAFKTAWGYWAAVCAIEPIWLASAQANVTAGFGAIDGGLGTLAWSELPCSPNPRQLRQLYDTSERWFRDIDLVAVACHEIGHALGLPHLAAGNLMQPSYQNGLRKPQNGDIEEIVRRYGPPSSNPPPAEAAEEYVIRFEQPVSKLIIRRAA